MRHSLGRPMAYIISRALYLIREKDLFSLTECTLNKIVSANKIVLVYRNLLAGSMAPYVE